MHNSVETDTRSIMLGARELEHQLQRIDRVGSMKAKAHRRSIQKQINQSFNQSKETKEPLSLACKRSTTDAG